MSFIARRWARRACRGLLEELAAVIPLGEDEKLAATSAPQVSGWTIHQHLEHLWRADRGIVRWLQKVRDGTAETQGVGSTVPGTIVMWLGRIPRGRGRAMESVKPADAALAEVVAGLRAVRDDVEALESALDVLVSAPTTLRHPLLGCYTAAQWLRFAYIHHVHHRRIIDEIRAA